MPTLSSQCLSGSLWSQNPGPVGQSARPAWSSQASRGRSAPTWPALLGGASGIEFSGPHGVGACITCLKASSSLSVRAVLRAALEPVSCVDNCRWQSPVPDGSPWAIPKVSQCASRLLGLRNPHRGRARAACSHTAVQQDCLVSPVNASRRPAVHQPHQCFSVAAGVATAWEQKWECPCLRARCRREVGDAGSAYQQSTEETRAKGGCWAFGGGCGTEQVSLR